MSSDSRGTNDAVLGQAIEHFSVILIYFQGTHSSPGAIFCHLQCCADPSAATFGSAASESASSLGGWKKKASKDRRKRQKCASSSLLFTPLLRPSAAQEKGSLQNSPWFPYWSQPTPITPFCSLWWWTTRPLLLVMLTNEASGLIKEGRAQTSI